MIFYFSGTGNTRWAAEEISRATGERLLDMAAEINGECRYQPAAGECIGFCFPVHGWRPPLLVRSFINKICMEIPANEQPYCWALCTAGDDIGQSMEYLNRDLATLNLRAESVFSLIMPESYVGLPFMDVDKPEKERAKKETARKQLEEIKQIILRQERGVTMTYKGHWPRTNSKVLGAAFVKWLITDKPFQVKKDDCLQCGTCTQVCPVGNISGGHQQLPQWKHNGQCLTCFACYHHCPVHAIEFGNRTKHKGQYYFKKDNSTN
jgi:NAD-dependent dihydropyrimidine dehydrogenase PreA subunit